MFMPTDPVERPLLREWRRWRKKTQVELAEAMQLTQGHLSQIERGDKPCTIWQLNLAAEFLDCEVVDLLDNDPFKADSIRAAVRDIPEENRDLALRLLRQLRRDEPGSGKP